MIKRIPGGDFYLTCVHIRSMNPRVVVMPMSNEPRFDVIRKKIDKLGRARWFMVCMECFQDPMNGAPYSMRRAHGEIKLGD